MSIPRLAQRLECMIYRRKVDIEIEEIRPELNIVRNASHELRSSDRMKKVLQVGQSHSLPFDSQIVKRLFSPLGTR